MAIEVRTSTVSGCQVLAIRGSADAELLCLVADGIAAVAEDVHALVIDVDELMLTNVKAVRRFLSRLLAATPVERIAFRCGRYSGRRVLRRCGGDELRIFDTLEVSVAAARGAFADGRSVAGHGAAGAAAARHSHPTMARRDTRIPRRVACAS